MPRGDPLKSKKQSKLEKDKDYHAKYLGHTKELQEPDDPAAFKLARMACGDCVMPRCRLIQTCALAIHSGEEVTKSWSGAFALCECSNSKCEIKQMHHECYTNQCEPDLLQLLGSTWRTGSSKTKADPKSRAASAETLAPRKLWEQSYDQLRSRCGRRCGAGTYRVLIDSVSGHVLRSGSGAEAGGEAEQPAERKRRIEREEAERRVREAEQKEREREERKAAQKEAQDRKRDGTHGHGAGHPNGAGSQVMAASQAASGRQQPVPENRKSRNARA